MKEREAFYINGVGFTKEKTKKIFFDSGYGFVWFSLIFLLRRFLKLVRG
jgi:hypothetical protein